MKSGIELILDERMSQVREHGYDNEYDAYHNSNEQLQRAARKLLVQEPEKLVDHPPHGWDKKAWVKMVKKSRRERLIIAGALIAAQLDIL